MTVCKKPLLSIVIPTYNVEKYISVVLDNILAQTYNNWELILVDDWSNDDTFEIIKRYAVADNRINLIKRNKNEKGSLVCRNIGQRLVRGKYFIHFDSDDIIEPFCFEQRVSFMENNPSLDYATFPGRTVIQQKDGTVKNQGRLWGINPHSDLLSCFLSTNYPFSVWNNIYKTDSFQDYFWDEKVKIYTDFSYIVPCLINKKIHAFDENGKIDYLYRVGQGNAMTSNFISDDKYESTKYLFSKTWNTISDNYKNDFNKFFVLQFQRVLENGTKNQVEDFLGFYLEYYYKVDFRMSLLLFYWKMNKEMSPKYRNNIRRFKYLLYQPNVIIGWIQNKIKNN